MIETNGFTNTILESKLKPGVEIISFFIDDFEDNASFWGGFFDFKYRNTIIHAPINSYMVTINDVDDCCDHMNDTIDSFDKTIASNDLNALFTWIYGCIEGRFMYNDKLPYDWWTGANMGGFELIEDRLYDYFWNLHEVQKSSPNLFKAYKEFIDNFEFSFFKPIVEKAWGRKF